MLKNRQLDDKNKLEKDNFLETGKVFKKIAPPPPVVADIDQRIKMLEEKGRKRGRRNSWIGIVSSFIILAIVIIVGYYIMSEINKIVDKVDVDNNSLINAVEDPDNLCSVEDACCLTSLTRLRKKAYMLIDELGVCPEGFVSNILRCETSLSWCEPVEEEIIEEELPIIDSVAVDTSTWEKFKNLDFGFAFNYPTNYYVQSEELNQDFEPDIRKVYVTESATSTDYYFILKIIKTTSSSSVEDYITEQVNVINSLASSSGVVSDLTTEDYRTKNIVAKKIITKTSFKGDVNINEEVVLANNKYIFIITYPYVAVSEATSSQEDVKKAIVISFGLIDEIKKDEEIFDKNLIENNDELNQVEKSVIDSDGDGLSDEEELKYNSDPQKIDTDGDGFFDGDEVKNGYNPNGEGLL